MSVFRSVSAVVSILALVSLAAAGCSEPKEKLGVVDHAVGEFPDAADAASWRQFGGPGRDFKVDAAGLAGSWPAQGPPELWSRALGEGYSAIAADRGALFTMYREGDDDVVVALRADDGSTIWERRDAAPARKANQVQFGVGPHATPLVLEDRVITLGYTGVLNCLSLETGEPIWSRELVEELDGDVLDFGYSASPLLYRDTVIVLVGGKSHAVVAFDPQDGSAVWSSRPGSVSYATPIVIDVDGQDQLVYFSADEIIGLDAANGEFLWSHPCVNEYRNNATMPLWGDDKLLWVATQQDGGTRVLRLSRGVDGTQVEEVWFSNKIKIHFWNTLRLDDHVYASIGGNASVLAAIDINTGEIAWRERGFTQANFVHAGDSTIFLDAEGQLALVELSPKGLAIKAQAQIVERQTWTVPTLVGSTLYVRDKQSIRALDLGA